MRTTWKRSILGLLLTGTVGGATLVVAQSPRHEAIPAPVAVVEPMPEPPASPDPSVSLTWTGKSTLKVNQPVDYTLTVKNNCMQTLQKTVVQVLIPEHVTIKNMQPEGKRTDNVILWDLGNLTPNAKVNLQMTVTQSVRGEMNLKSWVTFTGASAMVARVQEPQLVVKIKSPESVVMGEKVLVEYSVTNTGDVAADFVTLNLEKYGTPYPASSNKLQPGETWSAKHEVHATEAGKLTFHATAKGEDRLSASAHSTTQVLAPKLDVSISGTNAVIIGQRSKYTVEVRNCGDVPLTGVIVREAVPASFRVLASSHNSVPTAESLTWTVGDLPVGEVKKLTFEGVSNKPGQIPHNVQAVGSRNTLAHATHTTLVDGIPALRMELVDTVDPVEKGGETTYEIRIVNTGSKADTNIHLECEIPAQFEFISSTGPTDGLERVGVDFNGKVPQKNKRTVGFEPIAELAPNTEAIYKVKVKSVATGDARFKVTMKSKQLSAPVVKEESTRVYGD